MDTVMIRLKYCSKKHIVFHKYSHRAVFKEIPSMYKVGTKYSIIN